jgi:hypothetical protein
MVSMQPPNWNPNPQYPHHGQLMQPHGYGYAAPVAPQAQVLGELVDVPRVFQFPALCTKCGERHNLTSRTQRYSWYPGWVNALLLLGVVPFAIAQMVTVKRFAYVFPLCGPCNTRWGAARVWWPLGVLGPIALGLLGMIGAGALDSGALLALMFFVMIFGPMIGGVVVHFTMVKPHTVTVTYADDFRARMRGIGDAMKAALQGQY